MKTCIVDEVEARITEALTEWDAGRAPSPDQRDYVILADAVLRERDPSYVAPTFDPFPFEAIADEMYEAGEDLPEVRAFAIYATARLYGFERPARFDFDALETLAEQIDARAPEAALEAQAQAESSDGHPGVEVEIETNESEDAVQRVGLDIEGAAVREVFERDGSSLIFVRVGFRGTDEGEVVLWVVNYEDPE